VAREGRPGGGLVKKTPGTLPVRVFALTCARSDPSSPEKRRFASQLNILHANGLVGDMLQLRNRFFATVKDRNGDLFYPAQALRLQGSESNAR
jgi:hypothetical protein